MEDVRTGGDGGPPGSPASCAQRLIDLFVAELQSAFSADISHSVRYSSLGDIQHPASWPEVRARVVAIAQALAAVVPDDARAIELIFSGVRVSGSVYITIAMANGELQADGLGAELDPLGCAVLAAEQRRLVVAFFPRISVRTP